MGKPEPFLHIGNLRVRTIQNPGQLLLDIPEWNLEHGDSWALVGESGSGKSLLARTILRLYPRPSPFGTEGHIKLKGEDLLSYKESAMEKIRGRTMAMVFQEPMSALDPLMTCGAQVQEALAKRGRSKVLELFREVSLPDPERVYQAYPHQISGGQKQRVAIAMALAGEPELLIADEPTTALDVLVQAKILELLKEVCQRRNMSLLFITHDLSLVPGLARNILVLKNGQVQEMGQVEQVLRKPSSDYTKALLNARPELRAPLIRKKTEARNSILEVRDLELSFPLAKNWLGRPQAWVHAVRGVSFNLEQGEILGLIGPSGCGKSSLSRILSGLQKADSGQALYKGQDLLAMDFRERATCVQMVFQDPYAALNPALRVGTAMDQVLAQFGHTPTARKERSLQLLQDVGLDKTALKKFPREFSGGQRQRLVIARALAANPGILICDEAVSALDVQVQARILDLLLELRRLHNLSILFITHDMHVALALCDRVLVMHTGAIIEEGPPQKVLKSPKNPLTLELVQSTPGLSQWIHEHRP